MTVATVELARRRPENVGPSGGAPLTKTTNMNTPKIDQTVLRPSYWEGSELRKPDPADGSEQGGYRRSLSTHCAKDVSSQTDVFIRKQRHVTVLTNNVLRLRGGVCC